MLLNLLSNAIECTPEGGRIDLRAVPVNRFIEVSVSDTGVGIAPEDQETVFEEFRQAGPADKKVEGQLLPAGRLSPNDSTRRRRAAVGEIVKGRCPASASHAERRPKYHAAVSEDILTYFSRSDGVTQAARKVAGGAHSPLALLLCVIVLAVTVDSEGAPNDIHLRDWTLAWTDANVDDDVTNSLTADDHAALGGRLSIVLFESQSHTGRSRPGRQSEWIPTCVQPRGPPRTREVIDVPRHRRLIIPGARYPRFSTACSDSSLIGQPIACGVKDEITRTPRGGGDGRPRQFSVTEPPVDTSRQR